jgi:FHA domain/Domain of unknown function (DUF1707)
MVPRSLAGSRASDADRDRALAVLREAAADGRLSSEAFLARVDEVLKAASRVEVARAVEDLTGRVPATERLLRSVTAASGFARQLRRSWRAPWLEPLALPAATDRSLTIGRAPDCDLVLSHPTVSRRHAQLRPRARGWELVDVGSTNGTRLNGWELGTAHTVRAGDVVTFGELSLAITGGS